MIAVLSTIAPPAVQPGQALTLTGQNFAPGAIVLYSAAARSKQDAAAVVVSAQQFTSVAPDVLDGAAGVVEVSVVNPGEPESGRVQFTLLAYPAVASTYPLCSPAMVKRVLGVPIDQTADDDRIRAAIEIASAQITAYCKESFRPTAISGELLDGTGTIMIQPMHTPVISVQGVRIDGQVIDPEEVKVSGSMLRFTSPEDFYQPRLRGYGRIWTRGVQNVELDYTAGYSLVPGDIAHGVSLQAVFLLNTAAKQGMVNESNSVAQVTTGWSTQELAPAARAIAGRYRRVKIGAV